MINKWAVSVLGLIPLFFAVRVLTAPKTDVPSATHFEPRYNLIFITVDALRADHTPFGNYSRSTMPATAEFFKEGINFNQAVTVRSKTVPAYSSMMSGLYPYHHGVRRNYLRLADDVDTLAERLKRVGYTTAGFVSSFVMIGKFSGLNQGFDVYDDFVLEREVTRDSYERTAGNTVKHVTSWLRKVHEDQHFFLFLHFIDPHGPYHPPGSFRESFHSTQTKVLPRGEIPDEQYIEGISDANKYRDLYDGEILYLDTQLAALYKELQRFEQNSWILFVADHGETMDESKPYFSHGNNCYEYQVRVPMVWLPPTPLRTRFKADQIGQTVSLVDVVPTSLDALQVQENDRLDGESLFPAFSGENLKNAFRFIEHTEGNQQIFAARSSNLELIQNLKVEKRRWPFRLFRSYKDLESSFEFYDLKSDGIQKANLIPSRKPEQNISEELDEFVFQAQNHQVPFEVTEVKAERAERTQYIMSRKKKDSIELTNEDVEKLKALGYTNE